MEMPVNGLPAYVSSSEC